MTAPSPPRLAARACAALALSAALATPALAGEPATANGFAVDPLTPLGIDFPVDVPGMAALGASGPRGT